jgi:hypothetical protein
MRMMELAALAAAATMAPGAHHARVTSVPVGSPDGKTTAFIRKLSQPSGDAELAPTEVVLVDTRTGKRRTVLRPEKASADNGLKFVSAEHLTFSADGKRLYVEAGCPCTSNQVYEIDVASARARFLTWGTDVSVLRNGRWRGNLLMGVHTCYADHPGCDYPVHVVQPDGKTIFIVPGTSGADGQQALARWLKRRGWRAS